MEAIVYIFSRQKEAIVYLYVASYVVRKSEQMKKSRQKDLKMLRAVLLSIC